MVLRLARSIAEALREQPMMLFVLALNTVFVIAGLWGLASVGKGIAARDQMIAQLVRDCTK